MAELHHRFFLQEVQELDRHESFAGLEIGLKRNHFLRQRPMLGDVRVQIRVTMCMHQPLFMSKMHLGILDQAIQGLGEDGLSLPGIHRRIQLFGYTEKILVLAVDAGNLHAVIRLPFEHVLQIGRFQKLL